MLLFAAACSDDNGTQNGKDGPLPADAGGDANVTDKGAEASVDGPAPDASPFPCDKTVLGKACTQGGNECGADHDCLVKSGQSGFCSCKCRPDDPTTDLYMEDSCPADHVCGAHGSDRYCFDLVANEAQGPSCSTTALVAADPTDDPFVLAARLVPTSYPFTVMGVRYYLLGPSPKAAECDTAQAHEVQVFVGDKDTPDPSPTLSETITVAAAAQSPKKRYVSQALKTPIELTAGQRLYVGIKVSYDTQNKKSLCPHLCGDNGKGEASFTNDTTSQPPYTWESFKAKGWGGDLTTAALGFGG
jgi:hypothetical protein